jgi:fructose-1,6-bisphosphatase/inositol monophosphatase family enzyme
VTGVDVDAVSDTLREAAVTAIAPRFRALAEGDIEEKAPGEVVTVADREAEAIIAARLAELLPGVPVVGEEAVVTDPALLGAVLAAPAAWLVDPLDGTANFVAGDPHWAVMVALVRNGETVAAWIYRHTDRRLYTAERGAGAWTDGARLACRGDRGGDARSLRGAVLEKFLTNDERARMLPRLGAFGAVGGGYLCAGYEYPAIIEGEQDFALFQRLLPWDHAPGALMLAEAGGVARRPDGRPFDLDHTRRGLLLAASPAVWDQARDILYGTSCKD